MTPVLTTDQQAISADRSGQLWLLLLPGGYASLIQDQQTLVTWIVEFEDGGVRTKKVLYCKDGMDRVPEELIEESNSILRESTPLLA